jgi:hypothetical protein
VKTKELHYYTIRNIVTGEKSLVHAPSRGRARSGFANIRFEVTLTGQQELLDLTKAQVSVLRFDAHGRPVQAQAEKWSAAELAAAQAEGRPAAELHKIAPATDEGSAAGS